MNHRAERWCDVLNGDLNAAAVDTAVGMKHFRLEALTDAVVRLIETNIDGQVKWLPQNQRATGPSQ